MLVVFAILLLLLTLLSTFGGSMKPGEPYYEPVFPEGKMPFEQPDEMPGKPSGPPPMVFPSAPGKENYLEGPSMVPPPMVFPGKESYLEAAPPSMGFSGKERYVDMPNIPAPPSTIRKESFYGSPEMKSKFEGPPMMPAPKFEAFTGIEPFEKEGAQGFASF